MALEVKMTKDGARLAEPYSYIKFENMLLTGARSAVIEATCSLSVFGDGDHVQVRVDSDKGRVLGCADITVHTPEDTKTFTCPIESTEGVHDIYLVSLCGNPGEHNAVIKSFNLSGEECMEEIKEKRKPEPVNCPALSATDSLGRKAAGFSEAGPVKKDKYVGLFYWTWHSAFEGCKPFNVSEFMKKHPETKHDFENGLWPKEKTAYFWNEPLFGYYGGSDYWVYRKHAEMLALAGVDVIFFDATNANHTYLKATNVLFSAFSDAASDGVRVPKIAYVGSLGYAENRRNIEASNKEAIKRIYLNIYKDAKWSDLWFYWEGKPLILAYNEMLEGREDDEADSELMREIREFFTFRGCTGFFDKGQDTENQWSWLEVYPQQGYTPTKDGGFEEISVGAAVNYDYEERRLTAMNSERSMGRSYTARFGDGRGKKDAYKYGSFFTEQLKHALTVDAKLLFIDGWNEWNAGRYKEWCRVKNAFPDTFDNESSRDFEPTKGDMKDNYYMLLCDAARKWKGTISPEIAGDDKTIDISDFSSWEGVTPEYLSPKGTYDRKAMGYGGRIYENHTARNKVIKSLVTKDNEFIYFYAECENAITKPEGDKWMKLYIDADRNHATGWEGYDFVINYPSPGDVSEFADQWKKAGTAEYFVSGNKLAVKIERNLIGSTEFEFKWADNVSGDIMDFYSEGSVTPLGRFNFIFTAKEEKFLGEYDITAVKAGENYGYYRGKRVFIYEPDTRIKAFSCDGTIYLPAEFLDEAFSIHSEKENGEIKISGNRVLCVKPEENEGYVGGERIVFRHPVKEIGGVLFIPSDCLQDVFGMELYETNGFLAIGSNIDKKLADRFEF